jgi:hypothetical protein
MKRFSKFDLLQFSIPLLIALGSFALSLVNYYSQIAREWEGDRPLATVEVDTHVLMVGHEQRAFIKVSIANVGHLSFVVRGLDFTCKTEKTLKANWRENSFLKKDAFLPLGLHRFTMTDSNDPAQAQYKLGGDAALWHIIDPNRVVNLYFNIPVSGYGVMDIIGNIYFQVVVLAESSEESDTFEIVKGEKYAVIPEYGSDKKELGEFISQQPLFPFSFQGYLAVPGKEGKKP